MSVYSLSFPGKYDLVCLRDSLSQTPAYEYKDGKRTDEQKTDANGCPLYRVVGAFPIIANQVFEGCVVHTTSTFKDQDVQIGQRLSAHGTLTVRSNDYGLGGTYVCALDTSNEGREHRKMSQLLYMQDIPDSNADLREGLTDPLEFWRTQLDFYDPESMLLPENRVATINELERIDSSGSLSVLASFAKRSMDAAGMDEDLQEGLDSIVFAADRSRGQ